MTPAQLDRRIALWPWLAASLVWTLLVAASVHIYTEKEDEQSTGYALTEGRASLEKDLIYRRWASGHGGVYVPPTEKSPPNPYLEFIPERDVVTTTGKKLTLVNPAYMTRQVHELGKESGSVWGHITSLNPIRPENGPDDWEARALKEFAAGGAKEKWEFVTFDNKPYLRLMRVLYAEERCLTCHAKQGYKAGEVRGGLATVVPLAPYIATSADEKRAIYLANGLLWLIGLATLWFMRATVLSGARAIERSLEETEKQRNRYVNLFDNMLEGYAVCELITAKDGTPTDYRYLAINPAYAGLAGRPAAEIVGRTALELNTGSPLPFLGCFVKVTLTGEPAQVTGYCPDVGKELELFVYRPKDGQFAYVARDLTAKVKAEAERSMLTGQLAQAQKMEAIGKLAGGVAHDFNNMLGVILGNAELALLDMPPGDPRREHIEEIVKAGNRSSDVTRQLLAFARKQTVAPKVVVLNEAVAGMLKMIRRLIGEDIDLSWQPEDGIPRVKIDPGQLDQIMANLAANARDAIEGVGKVTIETGEAVITEEYAQTHPGFLPGRYSLLTVSDDGCGIEREKLTAIFEPFYTTKERGRGTGLGLATVYGIVKQNGGFINVYSEPGHGATFKIYLPAIEEEVEASEEGSTADIMARPGETVLIVEDERSILKLTARYLKTLGYEVFTAADPEEALETARRNAATLNLVLTDVVMPNMNGRQLCEKVSAIVPGVKCLYMSGYTANVIAHRGVLDEGVMFISKPFGMAEIGRKVRSALDA